MKVVGHGTDTVWRDRAIERSTRSARDRAAKRVQQFLDATREVIATKASTEFTVQEVVDQSKQSVRSFYQYFDSKHELLLVLFEEEMGIAVARIREVTAEGDPLHRLEQVVLMVYDLCAPGRVSEQPLFAEFAQRLLVDHPEEVVAAYSPLYEYVAEIVEQVGKVGLLREGRPRRLAAIVLQAATVTAGRSTGVRQPITGEEVWQFCLHAIVPDRKLS
ncbi:MAG: TetR/AcrR family transcriptional regulator [bacterium]|nr:TetR/AcrR family transcriptional regulator [bacterium]MYH71427.1 TetR/AcrR family transcriptional regulator [Acidimicrobiia bacterium]